MKKLKKNQIKDDFKKAFTLAEILIAIGVIGIVAALTLPTLITTISNKIVENKKSVIEAKLTQGLNMLNSQENGLSVTYNNTEEFVNQLSKYIKITTICDKDNLQNCFAYSKINYTKDNKEKSVRLTDLNEAKKLSLGENFLDPAGFVLADGTPFIISYNNDCSTLTDDKGITIIDPDRPLKGMPAGCLDGLYDINGTGAPNKFGRDVQQIFSARILNCIFSINGKCLISTAPVVPSPMSSEYCEANKSKYNIACSTLENDYWAGAVKTCKDLGMRLPKPDELQELAKYLYNDPNIQAVAKTLGSIDTTKVPPVLSGIGSKWTGIWTNQASNSDVASYRLFESNNTRQENYRSRNNSANRVICIDD